MKEEVNLRIPGPTPCPDEVLEALSRQMFNYRGAEMKALLQGVCEKLARYLETSHDVVLLTASGTGGLEAAVVNLTSPSDRVVGVSAGAFGERFCAVAEAYGAEVRRLEVEWGKAAEPDQVRRVLRGEKNVSAVLLTHNETSTGVAHPIDELVRVVRSESDALVVVDAISSLGAMPLAMDDIDLVITGSQKAWGVPPGMAMLFLSPRAVGACESSKMPRFYFDLKRYLAARDKANFPFTPAIPIVAALDVALDAMLRETADGVHRRHLRLAETARSGIAALGLDLFADERFLSPTVTAVRLPEGCDDKALLEVLRTKYQTILARGQGRLEGRIVRIGHLGFAQEPEIRRAVDALGKAIAELGASA